MAIENFEGKNIQDTFQRVVQTDGTNQLADGTGSIFIPVSSSHAITASHALFAVSASHEITFELSSSHAINADTASFATNFTASGNISASGTGSFAMVGIGTSTPEENLHVIGNVRIASSDPNLRIEDTNGRSVEIDVTDNIFRIDDVGNNAAIFTTDLSTNPTQTTFQTKPTFLRDAEFEGSISASGNITASGNISASGDLIANNVTVNEGFITVTGSSTSHGFQLSRDGLDTYKIRHLDGGLTIQNSSDSRKEMTFDGTGNVGIGTTDPQKKLDIAGGDIRLDNSKGIFFATTDANVGRVSIIGDESSDFIQLKVDNSNNHLLRLNTTGVGIGTSSPGEKLEVVGNISASGNIIGTINGGNF